MTNTWTISEMVASLLLLGTCLVFYILIVFIQDNIAEGLLALLIITATIGADIPLNPAANYTFSAKFFLVDFAFMCIIFTRGHDLRPTLTPLVLVLTTLAIWSMISATLSKHPLVALSYSTLIVRWALAAGIISSAIKRDIVKIREIAGMLGIAVSAHSMLGLIQYATGEPVGPTVLGQGTGVAGTFLGKAAGPFVSGLASGATLSVLIVILIPIALAEALNNIGSHRRELLLMSGIGCIVLTATAWDAARGGLFVSLSIFSLLVTFRTQLFRAILHGYQRSITRKVILILAPGIMGVTLVTGRWLGKVTFHPQYLSLDWVHGLDLSVMGFDTSNLTPRLLQNIAAIDLWLQSPLFGIGGGVFSHIALEFGLSQPYSVHNMFLSILVGTGIPGLFLLCLALAIVLQSGFRWAGKGDRLAIGFIAGFIGFISSLQFNTMVLSPQSMLPFWFLGAAISSYIGRDNNLLYRSWEQSRSIGVLKVAISQLPTPVDVNVLRNRLATALTNSHISPLLRYI